MVSGRAAIENQSRVMSRPHMKLHSSRGIMRYVVAFFLMVPVLHAQSASPENIRAAATRSVASIQHGTEGFYQAMTCFSCHDHGLPMLTFQMARQKGIHVDETSAAHVLAKGLMSLPDLTSIDRAVQYPTIIDPAG